MSISKVYIKRVALLTVAGLVAVGASACVGKGKAPPPVSAPIVTKG